MTESISLYYLDHDRTPLLYAIREMAAWHEDLDVTVRQVVGQELYEQRFLDGELDVICEHSRFLFPARLQGHPVRCLAATQASTSKLLAADGIDSVEDLHGRTIAIRATPSPRISGTYWMRRLGLEGRSTFLYVEDAEVGRWQQWRKVASGEAHAVISTPLYEDAAFAAGLHELEVPHLPEVGQIVLAALGPFVSAHDEAVRRLVRALYRAIALFRDSPEETLEIMRGEPARLLRTGIESEPHLRKQYERLRSSIGPSAVPTAEAIQVEFDLLNQGYVPLEGLNPLSLWDFHYALEAEETLGLTGG
jgi:ABC-type nitrate/sulfonate/bicarbonate transport system substrate-binding protein